MAVMSRYPDKHFDLAVVDPPYGIGDFTRGTAHGKKINRGKLGKVKWNNSIPDANYFKELIRVSERQIIWGANYYNCFATGGALIWHKNVGSSSVSECEISSISFQQRVDFVKIDYQAGFMREKIDETPIHNCQKPVKLYDFIFAKYAKPGWKILDTHIGSGSNRIAAFKAGLDFVGCELDKDYFDAQEKRWKNFSDQMVLV